MSSGGNEMAKKAIAKRLNDDETILLISFVQSRECLWDENHADFKRISITRRLWNEIGAQLSISGEEARCKWKNLKDKFRKLLRKSPEENQASPESAPATPAWKFYNSMLFLKEGLHSESAYGNAVPASTNSLPKASGSGQQDDDFEEYDVDFLVRKTPDRESQRAGRNPPGPRSSSSGIKRKNISNGNIDEESQEPEEKKFSIPSPMVQQERKGNDDYHFLLSLLPYIQALDPVEKLELRSKIQNIVTDSYKKHEVNKRSRLGH